MRLGIQPHARYAASDFTRAKVLSWAHNLRWAERAQEQGFDEVILLNEFGRVAECTSANVFAVFGQEVVTPPLSEGCLPGITREVLLEEVRLPGVQMVERALTVDELYRADEVFITSTTRGLLPVTEIAGRASGAPAGDVCERLVARFQDVMWIGDIARAQKHAGERLTMIARHDRLPKVWKPLICAVSSAQHVGAAWIVPLDIAVAMSAIARSASSRAHSSGAIFFTPGARFAGAWT